jgi:predicted glycogen debranching enzyme
MHSEPGIVHLDFGRQVCGDLATAAGREWLVTNGLGGYASGTVAGLLTRRYHGLLVAARKPPVERVLLLAKLDETATYDGRRYPLSANRWLGGKVEPAGFVHLERFHLEGTTPVWTFALADALLEKRVWMQPGANTTYVAYNLRRGSGPLALDIKALVDHRDHHTNTHARNQAPPLTVERVARGLRITAGIDALPLYLLSEGARATLRYRWYYDYFLSVEEYRGLDPLDDNLYAGLFQASLQPGEQVTLVASTSADPTLDREAACAERRAYELDLLRQARPVLRGSAAAVEHLVLAADQFVVSLGDCRLPVVYRLGARHHDRPAGPGPGYRPAPGCGPHPAHLCPPRRPGNVAQSFSRRGTGP